MRFHDEQLVILKELFIQQQQNPSDDTFQKILQRVDRMLTETIGKFSRIYYYQEPVPQLVQDMYQAGILGLQEAIQKFDPDKKPTCIPLWVVWYVQHELFKTYGVKKFNLTQYLYEHPDCIEKSNVDSGLIAEDIQRILRELVETSEITEEDLELVHLRYVEGMTVSDMFRCFSTFPSRYFLQKRLDEITEILRKTFEEKGMGYD